MKKVLCLFFVFSVFQIFAKYTYAETQWVETSSDVTYVAALENSPWGILISKTGGGIYISRDLGNTWESLGLQENGVMDIKYFGGKIYAITYYVVDGTLGLFVSENKGENWSKIGPTFSPTEIDRDSKTIYLGGEHAGLWISQDEGQTWIQKMGSGIDGTKIYGMESSENVTFVSKENRVYRTTDSGNTWEEIPAMSNKGIKKFHIRENVVFAGSSGLTGLFLSTNAGDTWEKVESFGDYAVGDITYFDNKYYVGKYNSEKRKYTVYSTEDLGHTWVDTELNAPANTNISALGTVVSEPSYIFAATLGSGVYRYETLKRQIAKFPFLEIPWQYTKENELIDNITSFFDHSYPLLGYSYLSEPEEENKSTLNFLGIKNTEPYIYYSSHSGIDFGLKYGTEIFSPASGYATYYYCKDCGNSIKIDHQNGYQTTYMHLQNEDLVTKNEKIWVNKNDKIGKVGLTGRTTGPHLHFEVTFDKNNDKNFSDDFPSGRVDPFGWQNLQKDDPWKNFEWEDSLGHHSGSESVRLWITENSENSKFISANSDDQNSTILIDNKQAVFKNTLNSFTAKIVSYIQPMFNYPNTFTYIKSTSFILESFDQLGDKISNFDNGIQLNINLDSKDLSNINLDSIKVCFWNEVSNLWEAIPTVFDSQNNKLTANTNHLSWFAVFGEKIDRNPPKTQILISGSQNNGWYSDFPLIKFTSYDNENSTIENIFYSTNDGETWETYVEPFYFQKDGITDIIFKSQDINGNIEDENSFVIQVNLLKKTTKRVRVSGSTFEIQNQ